MTPRAMKDLAAVTLATVFVVLVLACGFAWGTANAETNHASCQADPNPNTIMVYLPEDLE